MLFSAAVNGDVGRVPHRAGPAMMGIILCALSLGTHTYMQIKALCLFLGALAAAGLYFAQQNVCAFKHVMDSGTGDLASLIAAAVVNVKILRHALEDAQNHGAHLYLAYESLCRLRELPTRHARRRDFRATPRPASSNGIRLATASGGTRHLPALLQPPASACCDGGEFLYFRTELHGGSSRRPPTAQRRAGRGAARLLYSALLSRPQSRGWHLLLHKGKK